MEKTNGRGFDKFRDESGEQRKKRWKERWLSDEEKRYGDEGKKKN